jgi:hypothetical protein
MGHCGLTLSGLCALAIECKTERRSLSLFTLTPIERRSSSCFNKDTILMWGH